MRTELIGSLGILAVVAFNVGACATGGATGGMSNPETAGQQQPTNVYSAVSASWGHTCAISTAGRVECWGLNNNGQVGDGTTTNRNAPTQVIGLESGVSAITLGRDHTCALTKSGGVRCWGYNWGRLGDGTTDSRNVPTQVSGLESGVSAISSGSTLTCALTTAGGVKCWGVNGDGQLGDGTTTDRTLPTQVSGLQSGITAVSSGADHACALTTAGKIKCWGNNEDGQLGDGTTSNRLLPTQVSSLESSVSAISSGYYHTCALMTTGGVKCWGSNQHGQLGDGTTTKRQVPTQVKGLESGVSAISAGSHNTCALTKTGGVKCWGHNDFGQIGDGTTTSRSEPTQVSGLESGVTSIAAGTQHTCAIQSPGIVRCWGNNGLGQLGDGTTNIKHRPLD